MCLFHDIHLKMLLIFLWHCFQVILSTFSNFHITEKSAINVNTSINIKGMFKDNVDFAKLDDSLNGTDYVYRNCENIPEENLFPSVKQIARNL